MEEWRMMIAIRTFYFKKGRFCPLRTKLWLQQRVLLKDQATWTLLSADYHILRHNSSENGYRGESGRAQSHVY